MESRSERWVYLDVCRIVAIFLVVLAHVTLTAWWQDFIGSFDWHVDNFYISLARFSVPLFFMLSGVFILDPARPFDLKTLYRKRILRLVAALLFWSAMYYALVMYAMDPYSQWPGIQTFIIQIIGGHPHQHWFLFTLIGLYIASPLLRRIVADKTMCQYFLVLWLIFETVVFKPGYLLPLVQNFSFDPDGGIMAVVHFFDRAAPLMVLGSSGYMVLGFYLHTYPPTARGRRSIQLLGLLAFAFTVLATAYVSRRDWQAKETFFALTSLNLCAMAAAFFITMRQLFPDKTRQPGRTLVLFSECAFGVYLAHDIILVFLRNHGFTPLLFTRLLSSIVVTAVVYLLSMGVTIIIKKIPYLGRYIS